MMKHDHAKDGASSATLRKLRSKSTISICPSAFQKLRQREMETRRRIRPPSVGVLGFTDWDVRICFGAYGFCAIVLILLNAIYVDRRCRHRCLSVEKRRSDPDCKPLFDKRDK